MEKDGKNQKSADKVIQEMADALAKNGHKEEI